MKTRNFIVPVIVLYLILWISADAVQAREPGDKKLTIGVHFTSVAGFASSQGYEFGRLMGEAFADKYGYEMEVARLSSVEEVLSAFIAGDTDLALVDADDANNIMKTGTRYVPAITFSVDGQKKTAYCMWHKKRAAGQAPPPMEGGRLLLPAYFSKNSLIYLKQKLLDMGITAPIYRVFSSITSVPGMNSAHMAVAASKGDFMWDYADNKNLLAVMNNRLADEQQASYCTGMDTDRLVIVINLTSNGKEFCDKFVGNTADFVKSMNESPQEFPDLKGLVNYLRMAGMKMAAADKDHFQHDFNLYKTAMENGWMNEVDLIYETLKAAEPGEAVKVSPDIKYCQNHCPAGDNECIVNCMN